MINTKILILGAKGMLGHALAEVFKKYQPILWDKEELDITDEKQVGQKISQAKPDIIINAAAFTDVDCGEEKKDLAMKVNGQAVGYLADACKKVNAILVHYSTDYVFDGKKKTGYIESDQPNPLNIYAQSKFLGEKLLQEKGGKYYLIRSSWLFGPNGKNFVDTILKLNKNWKRYLRKLKIVNDQHGKPTYSFDLAQKTLEIIANKVPFGIYHLTNETRPEGITWYDLALKSCQLAGQKPRIKPCTTAENPRPAKRPEYSMLINTKLSKLRDWQEALEEYLGKRD